MTRIRRSDNQVERRFCLFRLPFKAPKIFLALSAIGALVVFLHSLLVSHPSLSSDALVQSLLLDTTRRSNVSLYSNEGVPDVVRLSQLHIEPASNISVALCFKTLFGNINLRLVQEWVAYYRLLGFDKVFMWYRPEMASLPGFRELYNLNYVTMNVNKKGDRIGDYKQEDMEKLCLGNKKFAASYDWALVADQDEYVWFREHMGIKDFIQKHANMNYLSFGKYMYTMRFRAADLPTGFDVTPFCFTAKSYCHGQPGNPYCPNWPGRSKVMIRTADRQQVSVHGTTHDPNPQKGEIHFRTDEAHFKEWPQLFWKRNFTIREKKNFQVQAKDDQAHKLDQHGMRTMYYDPEVQKWFNFVAGRARLPHGEAVGS